MISDFDRVGWVSRLQAELRYKIALSLVKPGFTVIDVGAGTGKLGEYLADRDVIYVPVEPSPDFELELSAKYPNFIKASIFDTDFHRKLRPFMPADLVVAFGVVAELAHNKQLSDIKLKEEIFVRQLLSIPSKYYVFDIWDRNFFKRTGKGDRLVRASDPGEILNYVESMLSPKDIVYYFRPLSVDVEASVFMVKRKQS